ncbi:MAG: hypothetical protein M0R03_22080 [Novosphingobium sp.]|nr:hypothetical protein [Novosphingobium sp.]
MAEPKLVEFHLSGNIIPPLWYKKITFENGKPQLLAINILADIVYWYRPTEIRDEHTGQVVERRKKFKTDLLQRGYDQICDYFGCSHKQAKDSLTLLEKMGLIKRVVRVIKIETGTIPNCLFIKLNVDKVKEISFFSGEEMIKNLNVDNTI